jgi:acetyl esterase/lipase
VDWLLAALALFNVISMITVFTPRGVRRHNVPWTTFAFALLATELAWIWLPLQVLLAVLLVGNGALGSTAGQLSLLVLALSWAGLARSIWLSFQAEPAVECALEAGLGRDYRSQLPSSATALGRSTVTFRDWRNPVGMRKPGVEVIRGVPYLPGGVRQQLDIYRPASIPAEGCPVLLQIHGGAWMMGDKAHQALPLMNLLASRGWICVAANYRLSPSVGFPTHLQDCKAALGWVREHGADYGMDTRFVAVTGGSAGGHLAALMGLTANHAEFQPDYPDSDTSVQACVPFYGVYDFLVRFEQHPNRQLYEEFVQDRIMHQSRRDNPALWEAASPVSHVHSAAPPFMIVHGELDSLTPVNDGRVFSHKLREVSDQPVVFAALPGAEHAFEGMHSPRTEHTIEGVYRFLEWSLARWRAGQDERSGEEGLGSPEETTDAAH